MAETSFALLPDASEREELLTRLGRVLASAGWEHFVSAPILLPDSKFFPDRWTMDAAGVHRLTKRLLRYAGLGELDVDVVAYEEDAPPETGHHTGIAGWFAGIVDGRCRFGFDERHVEDDDAIVGVMCHEVAHAFRHHRGMVGDDRDLEEEDTDITTVHLGFGVLSANNAYRYRTSGNLEGLIAVSRSSESSIGYLSARALSFLLAAQVVVRREERAICREIARALESNQASFFRAAVSALEADEAALRTKLGVPPREEWPAPRALDELTAPIVDDAPRVRRKRKKKTRRTNEGERVFRVVRRRMFFMTALLGTIGAVASAFAGDNTVTAIGATAAVAVGLLVGSRMRADFCSDPACAASLPLGASTCPRCGGTIVGEIRSPSERLEAIERLDEEELAKRPKKKKKKTTASHEIDDEMASRYEGRPMLVIVDSYAFGVVDELPPERDAYLRSVVQRVFGGGDDWRATVRETMGWPESIDDEIRTKWSHFQQMARERDIAPDPVTFAWTFGDDFAEEVSKF
jgi:hypothetical protein